MTEESAPIEDTPPLAAGAAPSEPERHSRGGPGFRLGLLAGALAGAAAARLLAPKEGERLPGWLSNREGPPDTPTARIAAVLALVRARMQEASHEARQASQEAEECLHGRYSNLTHQ